MLGENCSGELEALTGGGLLEGDPPEVMRRWSMGAAHMDLVTEQCLCWPCAGGRHPGGGFVSGQHDKFHWLGFQFYHPSLPLSLQPQCLPVHLNSSRPKPTLHDPSIDPASCQLRPGDAVDPQNFLVLCFSPSWVRWEPPWWTLRRLWVCSWETRW
jgi:hypothetical protein